MTRSDLAKSLRKLMDFSPLEDCTEVQFWHEMERITAKLHREVDIKLSKVVAEEVTK